MTHTPSVARRNAQLRQIIRLGQCVHPEHALVIRLTTDDGFIEYCTDCMKVTEIYTPEPDQKTIMQAKLANNSKPEKSA